MNWLIFMTLSPVINHRLWGIFIVIRSIMSILDATLKYHTIMDN